ncbi:hypothetical protein GCM10011313_10550 [Mycetocola zhadangensis]|nr:hypothetical protein GCM10011313_10550 [Mycetocola zhadangensis]
MMAAGALPRDGAVEETPRSWPVGEWAQARGERPPGAIIIPAHNEAAVIVRTLRSLAPLCAKSDVEVFVVCNGCTDETAALAREVPGVHVVEIDEASKTAALNAGDSLASGWPRLYLDADIEVSPETVVALFEELERPGVVAARPRFVYDTHGAAGPVRAYYRARSRIPGQPSRLWGAGGYAVNRNGHRRFSSFPAVTADDSWIDMQFGEHEKSIVPAIPMRVRTPRDVQGLLAVLTRQRRGQLELGVPSTTSSRGRALLSSVRGPRTAIDLGWYVVLTTVARRRSRVAMRARSRTWERDASTRSAGGSQ